METLVGWRLTAAVWIANIAVTALAIRGLEHPKPYVPAADVWQPSSEPRDKRAVDTKHAIEPQLNHDEQAVIEMPMATIVANQHGRALMQGAPDVVIGPGTVTHPSTIPPRPGH